MGYYKILSKTYFRGQIIVAKHQNNFISSSNSTGFIDISFDQETLKMGSLGVKLNKVFMLIF